MIVENLHESGKSKSPRQDEKANPIFSAAKHSSRKSNEPNESKHRLPLCCDIYHCIILLVAILPNGTFACRYEDLIQYHGSLPSI